MDLLCVIRIALFDAEIQRLYGSRITVQGGNFLKYAEDNLYLVRNPILAWTKVMFPVNCTTPAPTLFREEDLLPLVRSGR